MMDIELLTHDYKNKDLLKGFEVYNGLHMFLKGNKDINRVLKKKYVTDSLSKLADSLTKRFGLNIMFSSDIKCGACTISLDTGSNTTIKRDAVKWQENAKLALKGGNVSDGDKKILEGYIANTEATRESFVDGVTVDFKSGKIYGLQSKAKAIIYLDFPMLITYYNLSASEIFAIILHEIGHTFTAIMYMHRMSGDSLSHTESLRAWLDDDIKPITLTLGKSKIDLTKKNSVELITRHIANEVKYIKHTYTDTERQADGFATSFGYGEHLITSLAKMHNVDPNKNLLLSTNNTISNSILSTLYVFLYIPLLTMYTATGLVILDTLIIGALTAVMTSLLGTNDSKETTYDNLKDRLDKIKRNIVRGLRENLIPKDQVAITLLTIERIEEYMKTLNIDVSAFDTIYNLFNKTANTTKLYKTLETLSENDLHYLKEKL